MVKGFTFKCCECPHEISVKVERFEEFTVKPLLCGCGKVPPVPTQKLFWIALRLMDAWLGLLAFGVIPDGVPRFSSHQPLQLVAVPFRLKQHPERYELQPEYQARPGDTPTPGVLCLDPYGGAPLDTLFLNNRQAWQGLTQLAHLSRRLNEEISESAAFRVQSVDPYAPSAIYRRR